MSPPGGKTPSGSSDSEDRIAFFFFFFFLFPLCVDVDLKVWNRKFARDSQPTNLVSITDTQPKLHQMLR